MVMKANIQRNQFNDARVLFTDHLTFQGLSGNGFGYGLPPTLEDGDRFTEATASKINPGEREFAESDPINLVAARSMFTVTGLDAALHRLRTKEDSPSRRAAGIREAAIAAKRENEAAKLAAAAHRQTLAERDAKLHALPATDAAKELRQREIRDDFRTMPAAKRTAALDAINSGRAADLIEALAGSPTALDDHVAAAVQTAWRGLVARRNPKAAAELQAQQKNAAWAHGVIEASETYIGRLTAGVMSPGELAAAAADNAA